MELENRENKKKNYYGKHYGLPQIIKNKIYKQQSIAKRDEFEIKLSIMDHISYDSLHRIYFEPYNIPNTVTSEHPDLLQFADALGGFKVIVSRDLSTWNNPSSILICFYKPFNEYITKGDIVRGWKCTYIDKEKRQDKEFLEYWAKEIHNRINNRINKCSEKVNLYNGTNTYGRSYYSISDSKNNKKALIGWERTRRTNKCKCRCNENCDVILKLNKDYCNTKCVGEK